MGEADTELVRDEVGRLAESRLAVLEARLAADLALGRAAEVVSELAELTRRHPLRERLHVQYMTALRHSGRRAESLAAYRRMRAVTVAELGLEPSEEARSLHESLLADATPAPTVADVRRLARLGRHTDARADTGDQSAAEQLAEVLVGQGRTDEAIDILRDLPVGSIDMSAAKRLAELLAIQGRIDELRARADTGDRFAPGELADVLAAQGRIDELRARANTGDPSASARLTEVLVAQGRVDEAIDILRARADTGDSWATKRLAKVLVAQGRADEAINILRARARTGDSWPAEPLAEALAVEGRIEELRARADTGDWHAAQQLARLLSE